MAQSSKNILKVFHMELMEQLDQTEAQEWLQKAKTINESAVKP
jgi:hypothetical protein